MRVTSGTPGASGATDYIAFRDGSTPKGTTFALTDLTSSFQNADISVTSADQSTVITLRSDNASAFTIEIIVYGAVDGTKAPAQFPINSAAGATYGADLATAESPVWPALPVAFTSLIAEPVIATISGAWTTQGAPIAFVPGTNSRGGVTLNSFTRTAAFAGANIAPVNKATISGATAGRTIRITAWFYNNVGASRTLRLRLREDGGADAAEETGTGTVVLAPGVWTMGEIQLPIVKNDRTQVWMNILSDAAEAYDTSLGFMTLDEGTVSSQQFLNTAIAGTTQSAATLAIATKKWTTGVIDSTAYGCPISDDFILNGETDGNAEFIAWFSSAALTGGEESQALSALEAVFNVDAGNCSFYALNETTGLPMWVVGTGIPFTAP